MHKEVMTVNLIEKGSFLGTRLLGRELRKQVESKLTRGEDVILNFDRVSMISHSFGDELVGKLSEKVGMDTFKKRVIFKNVPPQIAPILRFVISNRQGIVRES